MNVNSKRNTAKIAVIGAVVGLLNGVFGSGGGAVAVPAMQKYLDVETHKSHATAIAVILPLSCVSLIVYMNNQVPDIKTLIWVSAGGVIGGYFGAKQLKKFKSSALHKIFGVFMVAASVRMII